MKGQPLFVYLIKPPKALEMVQYKFESVPEVGLLPIRVELKPHFYAKNWVPETMDDVHTIYSPPQDREYEDWEIAIMRGACKVRGLRFQLHPPPVTMVDIFLLR